MGLNGDVALALWRKGIGKLELMEIDTLADNGVQWPLKEFRQVVGIH